MKRRRRGGLGSTSCRLPSERKDLGQCATVGKLTLCVGDRVTRADIKTGKGTVLAISAGRDNRGKGKTAANVCFDGPDAGPIAYPYLFGELKKTK